ncbi:hypothetical protein KKH43_02955 [Patescibacteria group bacterium]|nr:hypothetical protein [Patescibacteria group bacterium]
MEATIFQIILGGFLASVVWFIVGGALYLNPLVAKMYKNAEGSPGLKKWSSNPKYLTFQYLGALVQCLLWAVVFAFIQPIFPESIMLTGLYFGLVLVAIKIIPRGYDMWIQTTYPNKLLVVEFVNGTIGSFVIAFVIAYFV